MNTDQLELGATYFRIAYADVAQTMPSVEPLVYVGMNIFGSPPDGSDAKYYFQDAVSVVQFGPNFGPDRSIQTFVDIKDSDFEGEEECIYSAHEAREIGDVIVDLSGLASEIFSAIERAKDLDFPKLSKAKGNWTRNAP